MHYFLSIKMFYKNEGKKSLFFYLKWVLGALLLLIPTAVLAGIKPTEKNGTSRKVCYDVNVHQLVKSNISSV